MPAAPAAPDLLAWPEVKAAQDRARAAETALRRARHLAHHAPRGQRTARLKALSEASAEALRAGVELQRVRDGHG